MNYLILSSESMSMAFLANVIKGIVVGLMYSVYILNSWAIKDANWGDGTANKFLDGVFTVLPSN
jgi:hypothetical protein